MNMNWGIWTVGVLLSDQASTEVSEELALGQKLA